MFTWIWQTSTEGLWNHWNMVCVNWSMSRGVRDAPVQQMLQMLYFHWIKLPPEVTKIILPDDNQTIVLMIQHYNNCVSYTTPFIRRHKWFLIEKEAQGIVEQSRKNICDLLGFYRYGSTKSTDWTDYGIDTWRVIDMHSIMQHIHSSVVYEFNASPSVDLQLTKGGHSQCCLWWPSCPLVEYIQVSIYVHQRPCNL